jgi:hypothetical protein
MSKKKIGLYLGLNSIGAVAMEGKKVLSAVRYDLSSVEEEAKVENLNEEIKWQALINKILREIGSEEKDIYVSLTDKEFIFRSLEMPLMSKKSIDSSLVFEIEKYIPFKIEELMWDYSYVRYPKEKKLNISFVGIRENNIYKIQEMFAHLNLNAVTIEPSSLSLVKILKSSKQFAQVKNFALLDVTDSESYLTFFYEDLPVFSQYITIAKKGNALDTDKFLESVRLSFQYFKREFRTYELEKFIMISSRKDEAINTSLAEELQVNVESVSPYELANIPQAELETIKALGVVTSDSPYKFRPVLKKTEEYSEAKVLEGGETPLKGWLIAGLIGAGLLISMVIAIVFGNEASVLQYKLEKEEAALQRPKELKGIPWSDAEAVLSKKQEQTVKLKNLLKDVVSISPSLEKFASLRPKGLWFESIDVDYRDKKYTATLTGFIFLGDDYNERLGVDTFISTLKKDPGIKENFPNVEMVSLERRTIGEYTVTYFTIRLNKVNL